MQASWSQGTLHSSMLPLTDMNKRNQLDLLGCYPRDFLYGKEQSESKRLEKEKKTKNKIESSRRGKWTQVAVCCSLCQISRLWPQDNIHSLFSSMACLKFQTLSHLFFSNDAKPSLLPSFQVSNEKKRKAGKKTDSLQEYFWWSLSLVLLAHTATSFVPAALDSHYYMFIFIP